MNQGQFSNCFIILISLGYNVNPVYKLMLHHKPVLKPCLLSHIWPLHTSLSRHFALYKDKIIYFIAEYKKDIFVNHDKRMTVEEIPRI